MRALRYLGRLGREFVSFAMQNKAWWIIPIVLALLGLTLLIFATHGAVLTSIYTLF